MPQRHRILCVDDDPMNIEILEYILQDEYELLVARSGREALETLRRTGADLVLLDIMMPELDGYETCRRIRELPGLEHVKVLLVSAKAQVADRLRGYEAGADDYITKPFDEEELLAKVRVFLRLKSAEEVDTLQTNVLTLVSHEMRTPLSGVMAPAEILASGEELSVEERKEWAAIIGQCASKLSHLIERCLRLCQYRAGLVTPKSEPVELSQVLQEAGRNICQKARNVTLPRRSSPLEVSGDREALLLVMEALLEHASRSAGSGEVVTVTADIADGGETVAVDVKVPGLATDPADLPSLFEPFRQADIEHHSSDDGPNLALALAREVARNHGGDVLVEACEPASAVFRLVLPVSQEVLGSA